MPKKKIVIIGGGVAGLMLATKLGRSLGRKGLCDIALIDRSPTHIWKPMLHTIAAGTRDVHQQQVIYLAHASQNGFSYEPGEMCGLARNSREVLLAELKTPLGDVVLEPRAVKYDVLVLALGSGANSFGTPGVSEHCHFIDSQAQAEAFNAALRLKIFRSVFNDDELRVGIVGAGATGVELAAELSSLLEIASSYGDAAIRDRLKLTLYESSSRVLGAFSEQISDSTQRQLEKIGFKVLTGTRVDAAEASGLQIRTKGLETADIMVWAAGVKAPDFLSHLDGLEVNKANQIIIRPTLQSREDDNVFGLGDCASLTLDGAERPLPPTAQVATQQAAYLAQHLPRWLENRGLPDFTYQNLGMLVSLSDYNAFGTLGQLGAFTGQTIRGRAAQFAHSMLYRQHQRALHGLPKTGLLWTAELLNGLVRPKIRLA